VRAQADKAAALHVEDRKIILQPGIDRDGDGMTVVLLSPSFLILSCLVIGRDQMAHALAAVTNFRAFMPLALLPPPAWANAIG
jgi:hypothetical protein